MADALDKVIDTAKKLRKYAKKLDDHEVQNLIVDLNLHLADLKLQLAEHQLSELQARVDHDDEEHHEHHRVEHGHDHSEHAHHGHDEPHEHATTPQTSQPEASPQHVVEPGLEPQPEPELARPEDGEAVDDADGDGTTVRRWKPLES